jgi:hypothetical protein
MPAWGEKGTYARGVFGNALGNSRLLDRPQVQMWTANAPELQDDFRLIPSRRWNGLAADMFQSGIETQPIELSRVRRRYAYF